MEATDAGAGTPTSHDDTLISYKRGLARIRTRAELAGKPIYSARIIRLIATVADRNSDEYLHSTRTGLIFDEVVRLTKPRSLLSRLLGRRSPTASEIQARATYIVDHKSYWLSFMGDVVDANTYAKRLLKLLKERPDVQELHISRHTLDILTEWSGLSIATKVE